MAHTPRIDSRSSSLPPPSRHLPDRADRTAGVTPPLPANLANENTAALRDLTALLLRSIESQRAKDEMLAVVSHELRHPLHLMRLALGTRFPSPQDPTREALDRYVARMTRLLDDLVDFMRLERNDMELQCEWTDVAALARGVAADFEPLFAHRRVALAIEHDNRPYWAEADPQRLVQVLANVFDNALKFTPAGGAVKLTVSKRDGTIHLCVRDNGKGIAPDRLPLLLHARMDLRRACGLGLGLAVSRRILERHGGTLAISSSGIGHGTAVLIRLPALDDRPAPARPVGSAP